MSVVPYKRFELVKLGRVNNTPDDFSHVVLFLEIGRHDAVKFHDVEDGLARLYERYVNAFLGIQICDDAARYAQRMMIVLRVVVCDPGLAGMDVGTAKLLRADDLAGRGLHKRRTAEKNRPLISDNDCLIRHRRHVSATRRA